MKTRYSKFGLLRAAAGAAGLLGLVMMSPAAWAQDTSLDLVIVVDDTGSMGGALSNISTRLDEIVDEINACSGGDVRWGIVSFKDDVETDLPFTTDSSAFGATILSLTATGGAGGPEASDTGLEYVLTGGATGGDGEMCSIMEPMGPLGEFRAEACGKLAVMCNDSYTMGIDDVHAADVADAYAAAGVKIGAVYVGGAGSFPDMEIEAIMMNYADTTGGIYVPVPSDADCDDPTDPPDCVDLGDAIIEAACVACGSPSLPGRMNGGGRVDGPPKTSFGYTLRCDSTRKPQRVQVNWARHRFHMTSLTSASCTDDPDIEQGVPRKAMFDTYTGVGTGRLNNVDGATITFTLKDAGEPGDNDWVHIVIEDVGGTTVLDVEGFLKGGNNQAL